MFKEAIAPLALLIINVYIKIYSATATPVIWVQRVIKGKSHATIIPVKIEVNVLRRMEALNAGMNN